MTLGTRHPILRFGFIQRFLLLLCLCPLLPLAVAEAQPANTSQHLDFAGLRSLAAKGQFKAVKVDSAGNIFLLLDQQDGVRILKIDSAATTVLAQTRLGDTGDIGAALALDPAGNVYVTGTTSSNSLTSTPGAAIPNRSDSSTNSFVARFDPSLNPVFVSFTGGSRIAATAVAATADAVFVTGITYSTDLPVTPDAIQQTPFPGSAQSGFVEKFSASGSTLLYATYLTGAAGDTTPTAIVADASDRAWIAGSTTASGFPTVAALVPTILSSPSGFLTRLSSAGDQILASTFVPGSGLTSLALSSTGSSLLASGSVSLGQFPVDTAPSPLIPTSYQVLLRLPPDLSGVQSATVIAPGTQSQVAAATGDSAWVAGDLTLPLLPLPPLATLGTGFGVRVTSANVVDQTARFGGAAIGSATFASLPSSISALAVDLAGNPFFAGAVQPTASSDLLATQRYDLPLRATPTPALPSTLRDAALTPAACSGSLCQGSAAYLARLNPGISASALSFSADAVPFITLRNLGTGSAANLQLSVSSGTVTSNCPSTLTPGAECSILLAGGAAGTLTASSSSETQQLAFPPFSAAPPASTIVFAPRELDFGIQTSTSPAATRTLTITNVGTATQTFTSALDAYSNSKIAPTSPFSEISSDCTLAAQSLKSLAPGGTCHITLGLTASSASTSDGILQSHWLIGTQDVLLTGYSQAASLSVSATQVDFGTQFSTGIHLPRYLFLSNSSSTSISHAPLSLPAGSAFTLTDSCPALLLPASICRIRIDYLSSASTSTDSVTLSLDQGISVLITGQTLPPKGVIGTTVNPNLSFTPASVTFSSPVVVTGVSAATQTVAITNSGTSAFPLALAVTGDFAYTTSCGSSLPGGQTCAVALSFTPSQTGTRTGLLSIATGTTNSPAYVSLSGTATAILNVSNGAIAFGSVPVGQPATQTFKLSQPFTSITATATGPYSLALTEDTGYGPGQPPASSFTSTLTQACHNCYLTVRFQPGSAGPQPGNLTLSTAANGAPLVIALSGSGQSLSGLALTPLAQDFGSAPVHSRSRSVLFSVTNLVGAAAPVTVTPILLGSDFVLDPAPTGGATCGGTLAYTATCFLRVAFAPAGTGTRTGTLTFTAGEYSATASLTGSAVADPGLAISPLGLTFSNVPGSTSASQTVTLTNTSGVSQQVGSPASTSSAFQPVSACGVLAPNASCAITVNFQPGAATVDATLSIPVTPTGTTQPTVYSVSLSGAYTASNSGLQILPAVTQFGPTSVAVETTPRLFTLTNLSGKSLAVAISIPHDYVLVNAPCTTLAPGSSCSFSAAFLPLTAGDTPGTITATATPADGSAALSALAYVEGYANGSGTLSISGALIANGLYNFGQVATGQSLSQTFNLTNTQPSGSPSITIRRITSGPPFLAFTSCTAPLAPGQSCTVSVTYTPAAQAAGASSADAGTLTIESDAASSPTILNLSGQPGPLATGGSASAPVLATYTLSQGSLTFPTTKVGDISPTQPVTITNTGSATLHVASLTAPADFTVQTGCTTLLPAAACTFTVASTPQTTGTHIAALQITSDSSTALDFIGLLSVATPATLTLSPLALNFGSVNVGSSALLPVQVVNSGSTPATFNAITATGDYTAGGSCPAAGASLAAGSSCTIQVTFTPSLTGTRTGTLSIATSASTLPLTTALTGIGTQSHLVITPSTLTFGSIVVGASANLNLTLQNTGSASVTALALTTSGDYAVTIPCSATTLAPGASCTAQVTFTPTASGSRPGSLNVTSSDPSSPVAIPLSGSGVLSGGSFTLTVDGGSSSTLTVASGSPAVYHLTLTPTGNFSGTVVLSCAPVLAGPYANCSLNPASLTLAGAAQSADATINTITSAGTASLAPPGRSGMASSFFCMLAPTLFFFWRGRHSLRRHLPLLLALLLATAATFATGCGGKAAASNLRYTPAGSYHYSVTATSTSGTQVTQAVTLNLVIAP